MKKNIFFISIILIILLLFFKSYFNTNTMKPEDFKGTNPTIKIEKYFEGHVKAWGLLQDRKGKVTRQFKADMFGKFENNILTLEEEFFWTDGENQKRVWSIEKIDEHAEDLCLQTFFKPSANIKTIVFIAYLIEPFCISTIL